MYTVYHAWHGLDQVIYTNTFAKFEERGRGMDREERGCEEEAREGQEKEI